MGEVTTQQIDVLAEMTAEIVSAYVSRNHVQVAELPTLISSVHAALGGLGKLAEPEGPTYEKAAPAQVKKSITPDGLISFIDGKPYKTLKRHLSKHGLTAEDYRARYGLPRDYPMVAASYSEQRSAISKAMGLGRKPNAPEQAAEPEAPEATSQAPKRRGRAKKAEAAA